MLPGTIVAEVSEVKLPKVIAVAEIDRLAVTVPEIAGSDAIVTLLDMDAVTEPIWAVPATRAGREPMVTLLPIVTVPLIVPKVTVESLASTFIEPPAET